MAGEAIHPELNATVTVTFLIDDHKVTILLTKLLELLEINVDKEKLVKALKDCIEHYGTDG